MSGYVSYRWGKRLEGIAANLEKRVAGLECKNAGITKQVNKVTTLATDAHVRLDRHWARLDKARDVVKPIAEWWERRNIWQADQKVRRMREEAARLSTMYGAGCPAFVTNRYQFDRIRRKPDIADRSNWKPGISGANYDKYWSPAPSVLDEIPVLRYKIPEPGPVTRVYKDFWTDAVFFTFIGTVMGAFAACMVIFCMVI